MRKTILGAAVAMCLAAQSAFAINHLIHISEVYAGTSADAGSQFVELVMYSAGQNSTSGTLLHLFGPDGSDAGTVTLPNVASGTAQDRIVIATPEAATEFGVTADVAMPATLSLSAGRVCFSATPDCVVWGAYSGTNPAAGDPEAGGLAYGALTGGIRSGGSILRRSNITGNANTYQAGDDTNVSATDFTENCAPSPENNAGTVGSKPGGCTVVDAGTDAGTGADAGADAGIDAGTDVDAGVVTDAGTNGADAGATTDGGSSADAGDDGGTGGQCLAAGSTCTPSNNTCCEGLECDDHEGAAVCADSHGHDAGCGCGATSASTVVFAGLGLLAAALMRRRPAR